MEYVELLREYKEKKEEVSNLWRLLWRRKDRRKNIFPRKRNERWTFLGW